MMHTIYLGCSLLLSTPAASPSTPSGPAKAPSTASKAKPVEKAALSGDKLKASAAEDEASRWVKNIQNFYDRMQDYRAEFIQRYTRVALSRTSESRGTLYLKKPGKMRWEYTQPAQKLWIADGKELFVYDYEEAQVFVDSNFEMAKLSSSVSFLWGEGKLTDSFDVSLVDAAAHGSSKETKALQLIPKKDASYARLILIIDPTNGSVSESILYETAGNKNHFIFRDAKLNSGLKDDLFKFTPPPGVEVIRRSP